MIVCGDEVGLRLLQCCSFKLKQTGCKPCLLCYLVTSIVVPLLQFLLHKYVIC